MKKIIVLLILGSVMLAVSAPVKAQEEKNFKFTVKTNPLAALGGPIWAVIVPLTGEYKVLFEAAVSEKSSIQVGASYLGPSLLINLDQLASEEGEISGVRTSGFRGQGMFKYFLSRDLQAPEGFYLGPHFSYAAATIENKDNSSNNIKAKKLNINAIVGYQLITSGGFTLDIFTGMGFVSKKWEIAGEEWDNEVFKDRTSVGVPFGVSFGYAF